jgi:hypothetical protein
MRRLLAALLVGTALVGAAYLGSPRLGNQGTCLSMGGLGGPIPASQRGWFPCGPYHRAGWQIPVSVLIGVLGVAGGLVVLRTRPKQPVGNSTQAA